MWAALSAWRLCSVQQGALHVFVCCVWTDTHELWLHWAQTHMIHTHAPRACGWFVHVFCLCMCVLCGRKGRGWHLVHNNYAMHRLSACVCKCVVCVGCSLRHQPSEGFWRFCGVHDWRMEHPECCAACLDTTHTHLPWVGWVLLVCEGTPVRDELWPKRSSLTHYL